MRVLGPVVLTLFSLSACGGRPPLSASGAVDDDSIRLVVGDDVYVTGDRVVGDALANLRRVSPPATPATSSVTSGSRRNRSPSAAPPTS